ncbi:hypothetical protein OPT61_g3054 [Boeremia exigua]|uniref:Uncharacterized protein n=1 Tax=Boeremia exigua TaxID=749465 RepID=A0ACC2IJA9_9PLEO|nr:hypothetical protein OPT61_g3054 [Boeremia exigua]
MSMVSQTLQGAVLSITSNVLAQGLTAYKDSTPFSLNINQVLKFAIFSIVSNPPNILWQGLLEDLFPTNVASTAHDPDVKTVKPATTEKSKKNILIKFLLDQTIGAVVNTLMFLAFMGYVNGPQQGTLSTQSTWDVIRQDCEQKLWPMIKDGYKFWPAISLISFVWVPVDKRVLFGCSVGVVWGIYLSLMAGA